MTAALGIGYALWLRGKSALVAGWALVFALALAVQAIPAFTSPLALGTGLKFGIPPIVLAIPIALAPIVALLNVLTYGPVDVSAKASPFPLHARLLPVSTRALVGWPMLFALLAIVPLWLGLLALVFHPSGLTTSFLWPTIMVLGAVLWTQALAWIPVPLPVVRIALFLLLVAVPLCLAAVDLRDREDYWTLVGIAMGWAAAPYAVAIVGLGRARVGGELTLGIPARAERATANDRPFPSPRAARRWYEWRATTFLFASMFGVIVVLLVVYETMPVWRPSSPLNMPIGRYRIPLPILNAAWTAVLVPILASATLGGRVGAFAGWRKPGLPAFLVLRPVGTARLVGDKLMSATVGAAFMVASTLAVTIIAYMTYRTRLGGSVGLAIDRELEGVSAVDCVALVLLFAGIVWRNLVVDLWTTMTGRKWPSRVVALYAAFAIAGFPAIAVWLGQHREVRAAIDDSLPHVAAVLLVVKLVAAIVLARTSLRSGLLAPRVVLASAVVWLGLVASALVLVARFKPITPLTAAVVALLVPLARVAAAPLALGSSRHA